MELTLKLKVKSIVKKTSAVFFKNLKVDDEIELKYDLSGAYKSAPTISVCKDGVHQLYNNALQLSSNLEKFEFEKIN